MKNRSKSSLKIPTGSQLFLKNSTLSVKGFNGILSLNLKKYLNDPSLTFRFLEQTLIGTHLGFVSRLVFVGVGFRVEFCDKHLLKLKLGFSHFIFIKIPSNIEVNSPTKTSLILKSLNHQKLNEFICRIRTFKLPDVYKGKGILFKNQILFLKKGKKK
jgi:large subunit ribosomal protein L6